MITTIHKNQVREIKYYDPTARTCSIKIVGTERWFHNYSVDSLIADGGLDEIIRMNRS